MLVTEATALPPGRALDVGCGEGADAIWLAQRGWHVTGVDISRVALDRAVAAAGDLADQITWKQADLLTTPPPAREFDLVSVAYFPLPRQSDHDALRSLLDAVAPGGTLLFVTHDVADLAPSQGFDPADYYQPTEIVELLDGGWTVLVDETRPRAAQNRTATAHRNDAVLRAVKHPVQVSQRR